MARVRIQFGLLLIAFFNLILNWVFFCGARRFILRLVGCRIGPQVGFHNRIKITWPGRLWIGANSTINFGCFLDTRGEIRVGENVMVGHACSIYTMSHALDSPDFQDWKKAVSIEDRAVLFPHVLVMPGVTIGQGGVVLPGSVVTRDVLPYTVVGGCPARYIKNRTKDLSYILDYTYFCANS